MTEPHYDPDAYAALVARPFADKEAANKAIAMFFADVMAARLKHGIQDAVVISAPLLADGRRWMSVSNCGDSGMVLEMVASAFRALREKQDREVLAMAGLVKEDE